MVTCQSIISILLDLRCWLTFILTIFYHHHPLWSRSVCIFLFFSHLSNYTRVGRWMTQRLPLILKSTSGWCYLDFFLWLQCSWRHCILSCIQGGRRFYRKAKYWGLEYRYETDPFHQRDWWIHSQSSDENSLKRKELYWMQVWSLLVSDSTWGFQMKLFGQMSRFERSKPQTISVLIQILAAHHTHDIGCSLLGSLTGSDHQNRNALGRYNSWLCRICARNYRTMFVLCAVLWSM